MRTNRTIEDIIDRLGREKEVEVISSLIVDQASKRSDRSFVLALDAEYGAGKSFFLDMLAEKLGQRHPVARIDAWADDSGNEPSVSIMAAIEDAIEPHLKMPKAKAVRGRLDTVRRNIMPILVKGAGGVVTKAIARYVDETAVKEIEQLIEVDCETNQSAVGETIRAGATAGIEAIGEGLTDLADQHAKALIEDYRRRKKSRAAFKESMAQMVASLVEEDIKTIAPLIVIVDELDRCRPDYAIKVLEEIKHFFDVPGVAFVMAIHHGQLSASVKSVYGAEFKSDEYLRRFFDWTASLQPKTMSALIADQMLELGLDWTRMRCPPKDTSMKNVEGDAEDFIAFVLSAFDATPREAKAVMQAMALLFQSWHDEIPVELTILIPKLVVMIRGGNQFNPKDIKRKSMDEFSRLFQAGLKESVTFVELYNEIDNLATEPLIHSQHGSKRPVNGFEYIRYIFAKEYHILKEAHKEGPWHVPPSLISSYNERIRLIDRLRND